MSAKRSSFIVAAATAALWTAVLPASAREVPIPAAFLQSATEYELEIQAIEESGNWTFATSFFFVR